MRFSFRRRVIEPELLDTLPPDEARASLSDLERINRRWGGYSSTRNLIHRATGDDQRFTLLDLGAASGDLGRWIRALRPGARVTSLDYVAHHLERALVPKVAADAFRLPFADASFDYVFSSLFLHHFTNERIVSLFNESARVARKGVLAVDLERRAISYWFIPATQKLLGWDPVTVHDAPISVAAGFRKEELRSLAREAGLRHPDVRSHGLAFRLTLYARVGP